MTEKELEIMAFICDDIDQYANARFREALKKHERHLVVNVMINVATTTLSKVLLMVGHEMRQSVMQTAISVTHDKTKEGDIMIRNLLSSLEARGRDDTCYPDLGTKH